jgi:DNA (cytosine-5)-methyltransferase 1
VTYGSLFTGIGGLELGLDRAGMECRWQVELDDYCVKVLARHWPGVKRYGDIRQLTGDELEPVDLICGGFPCQDLSQAGKRVGIEGTRSGLWFEYARLVRELGPRYVLIENVPGLLVFDAMRRVVGELARLGYVGCWRSLRASEFGASHLRKRVFIVACNLEHAIDRGLQGRRASGDESLRERQRDDVRHALEEPGGNVAYCDGRGLLESLDPREFDARDAEAQPGSAGEILGDPDCAGLEIRDGNGPSRVQVPSLAAGLPAWATGRPELADTAAGDGAGGSAADNGADARWHVPGERDASGCGDLPRFAPGPSDPRWPTILRERPDLAPAIAQVRRVADGIPNRMDRAMSNRTKRLGRLGNAVVPDCAEWIGQKILEFEGLR